MLNDSEKTHFRKIGIKVKELRGNRTQKEFASILGCDHSYISKIENGVVGPSLQFLESLATNLKISLDWIITGVGPKKIEERERERILSEQKTYETQGLSIHLNEKIERLTAMQETTHVMLSMHELGDLLEQLMPLLVRVTSFERALLMLVDDEEGVLKFGHCVGAEGELLEKLSNYKVPLSRMSNFMVRVSQSGVPEFIDNIKLSNFDQDDAFVKQFVHCSVFVVPVGVPDKVIGVFAADNGSNQNQISQDDRDYLLAFVNQIAGAIEKNQLKENYHIKFLRMQKALVSAIEERGPFTSGHSERVTYYAIELAHTLNLPISSVNLLEDLVPLHDIGKVGISDSLIVKNGFLDRQEFEVIRNHTIVGTYIVSPLNLNKDGLSIVRNHHERFDGGGYPDGLKGEEIPCLARIVSIADAFDALTMDRPYRKAMSIRTALNQLENNKGIQFDPYIVDRFVQSVKSEVIKLPLGIRHS